MVVLTKLIPLIPNAMVQLVGLAEQWTLDEQGNRKIKCRITKDLSHSETNKESPLSTNSRINMDQQLEMVHGWTLPRIIHFTVVP